MSGANWVPIQKRHFIGGWELLPGIIRNGVDLWNACIQIGLGQLPYLADVNSGNTRFAPDGIVPLLVLNGIPVALIIKFGAIDFFSTATWCRYHDTQIASESSSAARHPTLFKAQRSGDSWKSCSVTVASIDVLSNNDGTLSIGFIEFCPVAFAKV